MNEAEAALYRAGQNVIWRSEVLAALAAGRRALLLEGLDPDHHEAFVRGVQVALHDGPGVIDDRPKKAPDEPFDTFVARLSQRFG